MRQTQANARWLAAMLWAGLRKGHKQRQGFEVWRVTPEYTVYELCSECGALPGQAHRLSDHAS